MSPILIKGLIAAGGLGVGGVGIWQFTEYMAPKTLQQKLEGEGFRFHPFDDDQQLEGWKTLAKKHKDSNDNDKFPSLGTTSDPATDEEAKKFRDECKKLAEKDITLGDQAQELQKLKKWCVMSKDATTPSSSPAAAVSLS